MVLVLAYCWVGLNHMAAGYRVLGGGILGLVLTHWCALSWLALGPGS